MEHIRHFLNIFHIGLLTLAVYINWHIKKENTYIRSPLGKKKHPLNITSPSLLEHWEVRKFLGSMEGAILGGKLAAEVVACKAAGEPTKAGSESELLLSDSWGWIKKLQTKMKRTIFTYLNTLFIYIYIYIHMWDIHMQSWSFWNLVSKSEDFYGMYVQWGWMALIDRLPRKWVWNITEPWKRSLLRRPFRIKKMDQLITSQCKPSMLSIPKMPFPIHVKMPTCSRAWRRLTLPSWQRRTPLWRGEATKATAAFRPPMIEFASFYAAFMA